MSRTPTHSHTHIHSTTYATHNTYIYSETTAVTGYA